MVAETSQGTALKVVAHLRDHRLVKGYIHSPAGKSPDELVKQEVTSLPPVLELRPERSKRNVKVRMESLKALFFVKSFEGNPGFKEVKFFETHPPIEGLWVRVSFFDDEFTEGIVRNSLDLLTQPGFYLKPPDPRSNNEIVFVVKASLREFSVVGVTRTY